MNARAEADIGASRHGKDHAGDADDHLRSKLNRARDSAKTATAIFGNCGTFSPPSPRKTVKEHLPARTRNGKPRCSWPRRTRLARGLQSPHVDFADKFISDPASKIFALGQTEHYENGFP
ncbi:MAG: hypothetical protein ACLS4Z_04965 [Christensenellaceae bacterium]